MSRRLLGVLLVTIVEGIISGRTVLLYYGMYNVLIKMILASGCLLLTSPLAGRHKRVCMYIHIWCNNVTMQEL